MRKEKHVESKVGFREPRAEAIVTAWLMASRSFLVALSFVASTIAIGCESYTAPSSAGAPAGDDGSGSGSTSGNGTGSGVSLGNPSGGSGTGSNGGTSGAGATGGTASGGGATGGSSSGSCDASAWVQMSSNANACDGHVGESCGWTTTNGNQGYTCQTTSWGTGCEPGGTVCPGGTGGAAESDGGTTSSGDAGGPSTGGGPTGSTGPSTTALPAHVLTGYWQDFDNGAQTVTLANVPSGYGIVAVAFANEDPANPGGVTFSIDSGLATALGGYTDAQFTSDIQTLHKQGRKVILSVGGANGTISVSDATSATNFASSVYAIMTQYGFDGVDIDLENGVTPSALASGLRQLSQKAGSDLVITLAPQTIDMQSTEGDYFQLALSIKDILTIVNMQYYNSGAMLGQNQAVYSEGSVDFLTALADIQLQGGLRPDQVGLGLPASTSGASSGYVSPSVVNAALDCLANGTSCGAYTPAAKYPTIRGAMTWSISWDASNGYAFADAVGGHLASLP